MNSQLSAVGKAVARWCASSASIRILDQTEGADGTWSAGGCVLLAEALSSILPGGLTAVVRVRFDEELVVDHCGAFWRGGVIDATGAHRSPQTWLRDYASENRRQVADVALLDEIDEDEFPLPTGREGVELVRAALIPVVKRALKKSLKMEK